MTRLDWGVLAGVVAYALVVLLVIRRMRRPAAPTTRTPDTDPDRLPGISLGGEPREQVDDRIVDGLRDLGRDHEPPDGWQERVRQAINQAEGAAATLFARKLYGAAYGLAQGQENMVLAGLMGALVAAISLAHDPHRALSQSIEALQEARPLLPLFASEMRHAGADDGGGAGGQPS